MPDLTLHNIVTKTLVNGDKYVAIDHDNRVCSFINEPILDVTGQYWLPVTGGWHHIGYYKPTCDWRHTLFDATIITLSSPPLTSPSPPSPVQKELLNPLLPDVDSLQSILCDYAQDNGDCDGHPCRKCTLYNQHNPAFKQWLIQLVGAK